VDYVVRDRIGYLPCSRGKILGFGILLRGKAPTLPQLRHWIRHG